MEPLSPEEIRVLGCLVEKERTVPDSYPLTLNALLGACNQTSNRDPVVAYEPHQVEAALMQLRSHGLTRVVHQQGNRAEKYRHVVGEALGLEDDTIDVLAVLLLRGPQTVNELRTRTERYVPGVEDVEGALRILADRGFAVNLGKRTGQREERWPHLLAGEPTMTDESSGSAASKEVSSARLPEEMELMGDRIAALEARVARLEELLG